MMVGECGTSHTSKTYHYYKCVTQKRKHACDKKTVNKDTIENQVVKSVMNKIMDDELMEYLADSLYSLQLSEETRIPQLKEELVNTERGINNMLDAIQKGIILDSTKKRLSDLEEQKKALEIELVQEQIRKPILTREQILFGITKFRNLDTSTQEGKRTLIESFVNAIYLYDTYALVTCNYKDGTIRISFEEIESSDLLSNGVPQMTYASRIRHFYFLAKRHRFVNITSALFLQSNDKKQIKHEIFTFCRLYLYFLPSSWYNK